MPKDRGFLGFFAKRGLIKTQVDEPWDVALSIEQKLINEGWEARGENG